MPRKRVYPSGVSGPLKMSLPLSGCWRCSSLMSTLSNSLSMAGSRVVVSAYVGPASLTEGGDS
jgi:hypothetical protein